MQVVYVLTNPAIPGLVKIDFTAQDDANVRIAQLYSTGVPVAFKLEFACMVPNAEQAIAILRPFTPKKLQLKPPSGLPGSTSNRWTPQRS